MCEHQWDLWETHRASEGRFAEVVLDNDGEPSSVWATGVHTRDNIGTDDLYLQCRDCDKTIQIDGTIVEYE